MDKSVNRSTNRENTAAIIFVASALAIFISLYYMQQLSLSIGVGSGVYLVGTAHNITLTASLQNIVNSIPTFSIAIYITYMMFVLALICFSMGLLPLFGNLHSKLAMYTVAASSLLFMALFGILDTSFKFSQPTVLYVLSYLSGVIMLAASAYYIIEPKRKQTRSVHRQISLSPDKPYTNLLVLSRELFSNLKGDVKIVDMHFDSAGMENLALLINDSAVNYSKIYVLANGERIGADFRKRYLNLVTELSNRKVNFEVRIMNPEDSAAQHERFIVDSEHAYKIPPLNIINKKSEHIVNIKHGEAMRRFDYMWGRGSKI
ncbi:MAG: hypothetical protein QXW10_02650 [Candidatus Micrarchaeaceae archaeon]